MFVRNDDERRKFYTEPVPVSHPDDVLLRQWITLLHSGERDAETDGIARYIIKDFALRQFLGVPQSPVTLEWLAGALHEILDYGDPLEVFKLLPRPKKRPPDPQRGWDVACWVEVAVKRGYSRPEAIQRAAETFHMDDSNVRRHVRAGPMWMNPDEGVWDEYFLLRKKPLPSAL
jgi:hypothetical protein